MKKNKHAMRFSKKSLLIMVSVIAVFAMSIGGVMAWLVASTDKLENKFAMAKNDIEIKEEFDGVTKKNVYITNTAKSETPVYIRANVLVTWTKNGKPVEKPEGATIVEDYGGDPWVLNTTDGLWYYKNPVPVNGKTSNLINSITAGKLPAGEGYSMTVEVMAQSIQAVPDAAVKDAWGITVENGALKIN